MSHNRRRNKNKNKDQSYIHKKLTKEERSAKKSGNSKSASNKNDSNDRITKYKLKYMSNKEYNQRFNNISSSYIPLSFNFTQIHGIPLKKMTYECKPKVYDEKSLRIGKKKTKARAEFNEHKSEFLKFIGKNHVKELKALGLSNKQISEIAAGHSVNGYNVHHKLPLHGGGSNDFSNFIFMPIKEHDDIHKHIIDKQIENIEIGEKREILIPWTDSPVFVPPTYPKQHETTKDWGVINDQKYRVRTIKEDMPPLRRREVNKQPQTEQEKMLSALKSKYSRIA